MTYDSLYGALKRIRWLRSTVRMVRVLAEHLRPEVWIIEGSGRHGGGSLKVLVAGQLEAKNYIAELLFRSPYAETRRRMWRPLLWREATAHKPKYMMVFVDIEAQRPPRLEHANIFWSRGWVRTELDLIAAAERTRHSDSIKSDLRKVRENELWCDAVTDAEALESFYWDMYVPYARQGFGGKAIYMNHEQFCAGLTNAELLRVHRDGQVVGGMIILYHDSDKPRWWVLGMQNGDRELSRQGGLAALYLYGVQHLKDQGYSRAILGGVRPFLADGVLQYKRKWGMQLLAGDDEDPHWFMLAITKPTDALRCFLRTCPLICEDEHGLVGNVFLDHAGSDSKRIRRQVAELSALGVDRVRVTEVLKMPVHVAPSPEGGEAMNELNGVQNNAQALARASMGNVRIKGEVTRPEIKPGLQPVGLSENPYDFLFRCNQFVLGPHFAPGLDGWTRLALGPELNLTAHPGLNVVRVESGTKNLTLLGSLLDPHAPDDGDREILARLLQCFESLDALIAASSSLGGRWVIVAVDGDEAYLFADAFGLRQAFHTMSDTGEVYVMSEAALGAKMLDIPLRAAARAYMDLDVFRADPEYQWPAAASAFRSLERLLPNHSLDLRRGVSRRFWPTGPLPSLTLEEGAKHAGQLFRGLVHAAAKRFDLALTVTCGIDSRLVLAASKDVADRVSYVTLRQWNMSDENPDIAVTSTMLAKLGLKHEVIRSRVTTTPEFGHMFKASAFLAHDHYGSDAEAIFERFERRKVALTGSGGEVARCAGRNELPFFDRKRVSPAYLARSELGGRSEFAERHFKEWLEDVGDGYGVNLMDLFEWEQDCGSWLAATQLEFDIAWKDVITPFNCRDLIVTMLSVPARYRKGLRPVLFERMIQDLWPDVLDAPVNPHKQPSSLLDRILRSSAQLLRHAAHLFRYRPHRAEVLSVRENLGRANAPRNGGTIAWGQEAARSHRDSRNPVQRRSGNQGGKNS